MTFILFLVWGIGSVLIYGGVLIQRQSRYRMHQGDRRTSVRREARADRNTAIGLFLTAVGSLLATAFVIFGEPGQGPRVLAISLALGAFLGVGITMLLEGPNGDGEPL